MAMNNQNLLPRHLTYSRRIHLTPTHTASRRSNLLRRSHRGGETARVQILHRPLERPRCAPQASYSRNHDFTLDTPVFQQKIEELRRLHDDCDDLIAREYGAVGEARQLFESKDAKASGIVFLDEGTHHFSLANGASLTVYASPYTPCKSESGWGFKYLQQNGHEWAIDSDTNVVITHTPPRGVLDYTADRRRAGSPDLFAAVAKARPRLHCFGHIHEGWGAKKLTWRSEMSELPSHFNAIDGERSEIVESLAMLRSGKFDTEDVVKEKKAKRARLNEQGYSNTDVQVKQGQQTLFINAAIQGAEDEQQQLPWVVDIELPRSKRDDILCETARLKPESSSKKAQGSAAVVEAYISS